MDAATTVVLGEDVAFREIAGEAVVLDLTTGRYFGLNAVATRAWTLLLDGHTLADVRSRLIEEFDVTDDVLTRDLDGWLQALIDKGLVRPNDGPESTIEGA